VIQDIGDVNCLDSVQISHESTITGSITSIGSIAQRCSCPKCGSVDVDCNEKTIKCNSCKSRSIYTKDATDQNKIQLNITDSEKNSFTLITDIEKIRSLLQQCNHQELSQGDLIENEEVLLTLSSMNVSVNFNPKNNHVNNIDSHNIDIN
jgi:hypothetical protein